MDFEQEIRKMQGVIDTLLEGARQARSDLLAMSVVIRILSQQSPIAAMLREDPDRLRQTLEDATLYASLTEEQRNRALETIPTLLGMPRAPRG